MGWAPRSGQDTLNMTGQDRALQMRQVSTGIKDKLEEDSAEYLMHTGHDKTGEDWKGKNAANHTKSSKKRQDRPKQTRQSKQTETNKTAF